MSGSTIGDDDVDMPGNKQNSDRRRNMLLAGIVALVLLSLFVLLGNPGLLVPPNGDDDKGKEAEATDDNSDDSTTGDNLANQTAVDIPTTTDNSTSSMSDNMSDDDNGLDDKDQAVSNSGDNPASGSGDNNDGDDASSGGNNNNNPGSTDTGGHNGGGNSHRPIANNDSVLTDEDTPVTIQLEASDFDGNRLTFVIVTVPSNGLLQDFDKETGEVTYTPDPQYTGSDGFTFLAKDVRFQSDVATIDITVKPVNDPPMANDIEIVTVEDTSVLVDLAANVVDGDGDPFTLSIIELPANGNVVLSENGMATYSPDPNYVGSDSFTYRANDGTADGNIATVLITVNSAFLVQMQDQDSSYGIELFSGKSLEAEYVTPESILVGKEIDFIILELSKVGEPVGTAEVGIVNDDLSVKRLFGTLEATDITESPGNPGEYGFALSQSEDSYTIEAGDRIGIKFTGGDLSNFILVQVDEDPSDPFDGANTHKSYYSTEWVDVPTSDLTMTLMKFN